MRHTADLVALSRREIQILRLVCQAASNKVIAARLTISSGTVKKQLATLMAELRLHSRLELVAWVLQHPRALAGEMTDPHLHPPECPCDGCYCQTLRLAA
jgi:DNA-binding NarL/FixJ family response regulator